MAPKKKAIARDDDCLDLRRKSSTTSINSVASKSFAHGRLVDFNFLEQEGFKIGKLLINQGWEKILSTKKQIYPELIKEFYENVSFSNGTVSSMVKKIKIDLDCNTLGNALGIPSKGFLEVLPSERGFKIGLILNIDDTEASNIETLDANMLSVEYRLFHSIIAKTLLPRAGSFNLVNERDIAFMYDVLIEDPIDLPELMINVMQESLNRPKAALPYGMFLTYVFEFFNVKLKGETAVGLRHSDIFNAHSLHRMDFAKKDGVWMKIRSRSGQSSMPPPPNVSQPISSPHNYFNYDFNQPNPYFTAMTSDQNPFLCEPPDFTAPGSSYQNFNYGTASNPTPAPGSASVLPTVRLCDDQIRHIIQELTIATSSRSSGDSASSVNDQTIVPHISSVFENMSRFDITLNQLVHDVGILNGRVFHHNESVMDKILREINFLKDKLESFETKADWVEHRVRSTETQTRNATSSVDQWSASLTRLSNLVETFIGIYATQMPDDSFSHPHLFSPPPSDQPEPSSKKDTHVHISSDDDDEK